MKRKQRKSLPWRKFGYVILIIIKFGELLLWISPRIIDVLRGYIPILEAISLYSKLVKQTWLALRFSTHFSVDIWWNNLHCVWYITCAIFHWKLGYLRKHAIMAICSSVSTIEWTRSLKENPKLTIKDVDSFVEVNKAPQSGIIRG